MALFVSLAKSCCGKQISRRPLSLRWNTRGADTRLSNEGRMTLEISESFIITTEQPLQAFKQSGTFTKDFNLDTLSELLAELNSKAVCSDTRYGLISLKVNELLLLLFDHLMF